MAAGAAFLVDPLDPESIAEGIRSVLSDAELADRLGRAGSERARARTWFATASAYASAFNEVLVR